MNEIIFKTECHECNKKITIDADDVNCYCEKCDPLNKEYIAQESIKETMTEIANDTSEWMDKDHYVGFDTNKEKITFLNGIRHGIQYALWELREYLDVEEQDSFWENLCNKMPKHEWVKEYDSLASIIGKAKPSTDQLEDMGCKYCKLSNYPKDKFGWLFVDGSMGYYDELEWKIFTE